MLWKCSIKYDDIAYKFFMGHKNVLKDGEKTNDTKNVQTITNI